MLSSPILPLDRLFIMGRINRVKQPRERQQSQPGANHNCLSPDATYNLILARVPEKGNLVMVNVLSREKQIEVLHHLVEGNTLRSTARLTGVHRTTIMRLMVRFGKACQRLMDREFQGLTLDHLEVDEIWTFVEKKQGKLTVEEKATRHDIGDVYLWTGIDQKTKLIPAFL